MGPAARCDSPSESRSQDEKTGTTVADETQHVLESLERAGFDATAIQAAKSLGDDQVDKLIYYKDYPGMSL